MRRDHHPICLYEREGVFTRGDWCFGGLPKGRSFGGGCLLGCQGRLQGIGLEVLARSEAVWAFLGFPFLTGFFSNRRWFCVRCGRALWNGRRRRGCSLGIVLVERRGLEVAAQFLGRLGSA